MEIFGKGQSDSGRKIIAAENAPESVYSRLLIIDDLITEADTKFEAIQAAESLGYKLAGVAVLIDREQGGAKQLEARGYPLHAALKITKLLDYYLESSQITQKVFSSIQTYRLNQ